MLAGRLLALGSGIAGFFYNAMILADPVGVFRDVAFITTWLREIFQLSGVNRAGGTRSPGPTGRNCTTTAVGIEFVIAKYRPLIRIL